MECTCVCGLRATAFPLTHEAMDGCAAEGFICQGAICSTAKDSNPQPICGTCGWVPERCPEHGTACVGGLGKVGEVGKKIVIQPLI